MARGVKKSTLEKLQEELTSTQESIAQYSECIQTLKGKEKSLIEQIEIEELKSLSGVMKEQKISVSELRELIANHK